jgi:20S proteasome alpha/beta subunit
MRARRDTNGGWFEGTSTFLGGAGFLSDAYQEFVDRIHIAINTQWLEYGDSIPIPQFPN